MKITQTNTPEEFRKLNRKEFHKLWFRDALTDKQIAVKYGITKEEVKQRRKELNLNMWNSAVLFIMGGAGYRK